MGERIPLDLSLFKKRDVERKKKVGTEASEK